MSQKTLLTRIIILSFLVLIGFCLARGIYYGSTMGIILALTSLASSVVFLYLLVKMKKPEGNEEIFQD